MKAKSQYQYVEVAPAIPLPASAHQTFTYRAPAAISPLEAVSISFGPRRVQGVVIKTGQRKPPYPTKEAMPLAKALSITPAQYEFGQWIAAHMRGGLGYTLRLFLGATTSGSPEKSSARQLPAQLLLEKDVQKRTRVIQEVSLETIHNGRQVFVLVPEVSMVGSLQAALAADTSVMPVFAGQTPSAKTNAWQAVGTGKPVIIIGTQKALFLPWQNLGLVIVEQAQYTTHKLWDQYPRLDNRYGARELARIHEAHYMVSGSAPSLEMWQALQSGESTVIKNNPYLRAPHVITATFEDKKNRRILPIDATTLIRRSLKKRQRIFVLYNKRGSWQAMRCRKCHTAVRCPDCNVAALVQGKSKAKRLGWQLVCRSCNRIIPTPATCPECHQDALAPSRLGGVAMQSILTSLNPGHTISRLDVDSLRGLSSEAITKKISQSNLIIGTNAALTHLTDEQFDQAFWIFPEDALAYPDIRSSERGWLMLSRLAQLSPASAVTLITRQPQLIQDTIGQDPGKFLASQLKERQRLQYPPFADLVRLTFTGKKQSKAEPARLELKKRIGKNGKVRGPYQGIGTSKRSQTHILLTGKLDILQAAYRDIPCDSADVAPDRII
ncbi:MAG: hypothetical protein HYZ63_02085 [Candidatus Andersenbacteria bacterium]|nr:hypothetical protein [Candidatus Andersenbacteria bacterium]